MLKQLTVNIDKDIANVLSEHVGAIRPYEHAIIALDYDMIAYIPINLKEFDLTLTFREFVDHIYGGRADFELVWKDFDALVAMLKTARKDR